MSVAVYTGGLGITLSHELVHKSNRLEQWLGKTGSGLLLQSCILVWKAAWMLLLLIVGVRVALAFVVTATTTATASASCLSLLLQRGIVLSAHALSTVAMTTG